MKFFLLLFLFSCSGLKRDPHILGHIRHWNLAGIWINETSGFRITCEAGFDYYQANTFENSMMAGGRNRLWIKKLEKNKITTAPTFGLSYKIDKLPALQSGEWIMTLNKQKYRREPNFPVCP